MARIPITLFLIIFILYAQAQNRNFTGFDDSKVIKDSAGKILSFKVWKQAVATGKYYLKPDSAGDDNTAFTMVTWSEEAENKLYEGAAKPEEPTYFKSGSRLEFASMIDKDGKQMDPSYLKGKIVVFNFWFVACPPCRYEMPELNKLVYKYKSDSNVVFIAVALDSKQKVERFLRTSPFSYHIIESGRQLFNQYNVRFCPTNLVVDQSGIIRFSSVTYGSAPYWIRKTIEELKAE